jgi:hypothetical protein
MIKPHAMPKPNPPAELKITLPKIPPPSEKHDWRPKLPDMTAAMEFFKHAARPPKPKGTDHAHTA